MHRYHSLSPEEEEILLHKGTEMPGTGLYDQFDRVGLFACKRCDTPLYLSSSKFHSGCGWPSFDEELPDAVLRKPDGNRTEILCHHCKSHLGHLFTGERFTAKNTRHCVNSLSLTFLPAFTPEGDERALVAGGCFWGVEYFMQKLPGVIRCTSGYIGGAVAHPTYEEVCSGLTGHVEAVEILFDPHKTSYKTILQEFFAIHNPTQTDGQGPDKGPQYLSRIYYLSAAQHAIATSLIEQLKRRGLKIATQLLPAYPFYPAEDDHQNYYGKKGGLPYCHTHHRLLT